MCNRRKRRRLRTRRRNQQSSTGVPPVPKWQDTGETPVLQEISMKSHLRICAWLAMMGVSTLAFADVTGKAMLDGKAPEMKTIDMSGVPACAQQHADPVTEETIVAGEKG